MLRYIDTHVHLTADELYPHIDTIMARAENEGMHAAINICTEPLHLERAALLHKKFPGKFFAAAGVHPHDAEKKEPLFSLTAQSVKELVAIGETGLDYHYSFAKKEAQQACLIDHVELAKTSCLPLIIHCREAFGDLFALIPKNTHAILHCFTGTLEEAKKALDYGWMISFSGVITFKKSESLREVVRYVPLERICIETDAPYLAPQSKRGKTNEPAFLRETLTTLSAVKNLPLEKTAEILYKNAIEFFSLSS